MKALRSEHHLILLNGPPRSGKSAAARMIADFVPGEARVLYLSEQIKRATHCAYGMFDVPFDFFEDKKDTKSDLFFGKSPREAYIAHSEMYMKKLHGGDVFVKSLMKRVLEGASLVSIIPDIGFQSEIDYLARCWQRGRIALVRLRRNSTSFTADSRQYVRGGLGVEETDICNETLEQLRSEMNDVAAKLLNLRSEVNPSRSMKQTLV